MASTEHPEGPEQVKGNKLEGTEPSEGGKKMTTYETSLNLVNTVVGTAVLSLPYTFGLTSYWTILLLFLCTGITAFTASIIGEELKMTRQIELAAEPTSRDYTYLAEVAFGSWGRGIVMVITVGEVWFCSVATLVLNGNNIHSLLHMLTESEAVLICTLVCGMMISIPMRMYAYISLACLVVLLMAGWFFIGELFTIHTSEWSLPALELEPGLGHLLRAFGLIMFCFGGHPCFPAYHENMQKTQRWKASVCWSFSISSVFFLCMGLVPYLALGHDVHPVFTKEMNIPWLKEITVAFFALKLQLTTPLLLRVVISSLHIQISSKNVKELIRSFLSVAVVILLTGATACFLAKEVAEVASLTGALLTNSTAIIIPCAMYVSMSLQASGWSQQPCKNKVKLVTCGMLVVLGLLTAVAGTYMAVSDLLI